MSDNCSTVLALVCSHLSFLDCCALLTVSKQWSKCVDLRQHDGEQNNVIERLVDAYERSMLSLRKFAMEKRTLTRSELWPMYGVELESDSERQESVWTIVAPSVQLCARTDFFRLPDSDSFGQSIDAYRRWSQRDQRDAAASDAYARVKTRHWRLTTPFLRLLNMHALRHACCAHTQQFDTFMQRFTDRQTLAGVSKNDWRRRVAKRVVKRRVASKRKAGQAVAALDEQRSSGKKPRPDSGDVHIAKRLCNFRLESDAERLLCIKH